MKKPREILIVGLPKSATTGLYNDVIKVLAPDVVGLFEPVDNRNIMNSTAIQKAMAGKATLVVKLVCVNHDSEKYNIIRVPLPAYKSFGAYEKKIFLIRDPRDNLISYMLYMVVNSKQLIKKENVRQLVNLIGKKERDPGEVSVRQILELMGRLNDSDFIALLAEWRKFSVDYLNQNNDFFIYKYEDYIIRNLDPLEEYLGFAFSEKSVIPENYRFVARTMKSGDWRNWFLDEDVEFFRPYFQEYMVEHGYGNNWDLPDKPVLNPAYGSEYVLMLVDDFYKKFMRKK